MSEENLVASYIIKNFQDIALMLVATISAVIAVSAQQNDSDIGISTQIAGVIWILYIIIASYRLSNTDERGLFFGFHISVVSTYLLGLLTSITIWKAACGDCNTFFFESGPDLFIRLCQPFIAPGLLLFLSPFMDGDLGTKGFSIGVIISVPLCFLSFFITGFITGMYGF